MTDEPADEDRDHSPLGALRLLAGLLRPHVGRYRGTLLLLLAGVLVETGFNAAFPLALKFLIDDALLVVDPAALLRVLVVLGVLGIGVSAITVGYEVLNARLTASLLADVREHLFAHVQTLSGAFFGRTGIGEILSRFSGDMAAVENVVVHFATSGLEPALQVIAGTALLFVLNWQLALAAMLIFPLSLAGAVIFSSRAVDASYDRRKAEAGSLSVLQESVLAHQLVRVFDLSRITGGWYRERSRRLAVASGRATIFTVLLERSVGIGVLLLHLVILAAGAYLAYHRRITLGTFVTFESVFWELSYSITYTAQFMPDLTQGAGGVEHINELLGDIPTVTDAPDATALPRMQRDIVLDHVSYSYGRNHQRQLSDVTFRIPQGATVAIVGASGSGKTTLLNLLLRSFDPDGGALQIDGHDIRLVTRASLLGQMAVVFQESLLFNRSIGENIRLGNAIATAADVESAARAAEIHEFVASLPEGYETIVGERGALLSGGQRQRIAIARALVRDPALLVLDEATSALDHETDAAIVATIRRVSRGRTVIAVTHRLASFAHADTIFVLAHGRMVQSGRHEELLAASGPYRRMWDAQQTMAAGVHAGAGPASE